MRALGHYNDQPGSPNNVVKWQPNVYYIVYNLYVCDPGFCDNGGGGQCATDPAAPGVPWTVSPTSTWAATLTVCPTGNSLAGGGGVMPY